tara:strand:- start:1003 stop:1776 length:774 start_codon:yes stop_codon:yes gene_type:complete
MGLETAAIMGISAGISALGSGASFIQAGKQRKRQQQAERDAQKAFDEARDSLDINFFEGRSIPKEPFELQREAGLSAAQQIVQAGQEGEQRGAAVTAGRAAVLNEAAQRQSRIDQAQILQNLETAALREDARLRDAKANLNLQEASGQQMIAADARAAEQAANMAGVGGLVNVGTQAMKVAPLYGRADSPNQSNLLGFNVGETFDPSNETFNRTQRVFNPSNLGRGFGAVIPTIREPAAGYDLNIPGLTSMINPPIF